MARDHPRKAERKIRLAFGELLAETCTGVSGCKPPWVNFMIVRVADAESSRPGPKDRQPPPSGALRRLVYFALAGVFFVLGALGTVLPVLPATPFLLLTSYFLVRSSPRLNDRLLLSRLFVPIRRDWQELGGVRPHIKAKAILVVSAAVAATLCFASVSPVAKLGVAALALCGIWVILRLPEVR